MNLTRVVGYDLRDFFTSWLTYVFLFFTLAPPIGVLITNHFIEEINADGFTLILAFSAFGAMFTIISAVRVFTKDISENTNILFMNSKSNRTVYAFSKVVSMGVIGLIYGALLVLILIVGKSLGIELLVESMMSPAHYETYVHLFSEIILSYTVISIVFGTIYFFLSLYFRSSVFVFVFAVLTFLFYDLIEGLGSLAYGKLFSKDSQSFVDFLQKYFPFSSGSTGLSEMSITNAQFLMLGIYFVVFLVLLTVKIRKKDY